MRPELVRMRAFGPYLGEASVDFAPLWQAQIFLITGPTGGGKTSILDAMSFALYGQATGEAREFRDMRCTAADEKDDTLTEFVFSLGAARYRFVRTLHLHKRRDGGRDLQIGGECHVEREGEWRLLASGSSAVTKKAEEILGFTHDQFSQVVVLPQGEFRRLLLASSSEKAKILEVLFATSVWQRTAEQITYKLKEIRGNLADLEQGESLLLESAGAAEDSGRSRDAGGRKTQSGGDRSRFGRPGAGGRFFRADGGRKAAGRSGAPRRGEPRLPRPTGDRSACGRCAAL